MRSLNFAENEINEKLEEVQKFVAFRLENISDINRGQRLVNDIQLLRHIWTKEEDTI